MDRVQQLIENNFWDLMMIWDESKSEERDALLTQAVHASGPIITKICKRLTFDWEASDSPVYVDDDGRKFTCQTRKLASAVDTTLLGDTDNFDEIADAIAAELNEMFAGKDGPRKPAFFNIVKVNGMRIVGTGPKSSDYEVSKLCSLATRYADTNPDSWLLSDE